MCGRAETLMGFAILSVMENRNETVAGNEHEAGNKQPLASVGSRKPCTWEAWHISGCLYSNHANGKMGQSGR